MVLIVSDEVDETTNYVIDWILKENKEFIRINSNQFLESISIQLSEKEISFSFDFKGISKKIMSSDISSFWYRKGDFNIDYSLFLTDFPKELKKSIYEHLYNEWQTIKNFIFNILSETEKSLGNYFESFSNKLSYLKLAQECGLLVPETTVFNNPSELHKLFTQSNCKYITKSIEDIYNAVFKEKHLFTYTNEITHEEIKDLPSTIFPSLIQKSINKKYELRIFFMNQDLYTMAIFSQSDKMTQTDFRNYNHEKPNRTVPFKLPGLIEKKLLKFIELSKLNTGSIDVVVDTDNNFLFLEVNPSGQFGSLSYDCNYYLEKKIANYLL